MATIGPIGPGSVGGIRVRGLDELNKALRRTSKEVRVGIRKELRTVAEPVRAEAEQLALAEIPRIAPIATHPRQKPGRRRGRVKWEKMRIGLALGSNVIYVAPTQRGVKRAGPDPRKRPNFALLLLERAMDPALAHNAPMIERRFEQALDRIVQGFSR